MPYRPGPFTRVDQSNVTPQTDTVEFTDDALIFAGKLQAVASGWDDFFVTLEAMAVDPLADLEGIAIDDITAEVALGSAWMQVPNLDAAMTMYADADTSLGIAVSFAPAQAWLDPPAAFVAPGDNLLPITPVIPPGGFDAGATGSVGSTAPDARPGVKLRNFTRIGAPNFVVGDTFEVIALGNAGQTVTASGTFNGADIGNATFGTLDANGALGIQGVMAPENVGAWHEDWYFDGQHITGFNFIVTSAQTS